jgi:dTDP-4-dehydrorhamnose reductase
MESLLIAGVDTMIGVNFAAQLADQFDVSTCGLRCGRRVAGCRTLDESRRIASPQAVIQEVKPRRLVLCPSGANSGWEATSRPEPGDVGWTERWLHAARDVDVAVTLISSDAVFTGPWMFHAENSLSVCPSPEATILRQIEQLAMDLSPEALILRTNAFGWASAWLETALADLEAGRGCQADCVPHASPILVNDLVEITLKAWQAGLAGVYHVAGAERCNPRAFAQKLAAEFGCELPRLATVASLTSCSTGYGCSETSLQTRKIRRALGIAAPLINDGLKKLRQLSQDGYRERLNAVSDKLPPKRAA